MGNECSCNKNPEENDKVAEKARNDALKKYYGDTFKKKVEEAYVFFIG